jgi:hypothetical protein
MIEIEVNYSKEPLSFREFKSIIKVKIKGKFVPVLK